MPKNLVCVVEGHGEVEAFPNLCTKILHFLEVFDWVVDQSPIKHSRANLVDARMPSPSRPPRKEGISRVVELASRRPADAVLVICDSDDDCPAAWGPATVELISQRLAGGAVMIVREFEAWLLLNQIGATEYDGRSIETIRDAKRILKKLVTGYKPTTHQLELTRKIDIPKLRELSDSFDKLVRTIAQVTGAECPPR